MIFHQTGFNSNAGPLWFPYLFGVFHRGFPWNNQTSVRLCDVSINFTSDPFLMKIPYCYVQAIFRGCLSSGRNQKNTEISADLILELWRHKLCIYKKLKHESQLPSKYLLSMYHQTTTKTWNKETPLCKIQTTIHHWVHFILTICLWLVLPSTVCQCFRVSSYRWVVQSCPRWWYAVKIPPLHGFFYIPLVILLLGATNIHQPSHQQIPGALPNSLIRTLEGNH